MITEQRLQDAIAGQPGDLEEKGGHASVPPF